MIELYVFSYIKIVRLFCCSGVEHEVVQLKAALRKAQPNVLEMKEKVSRFKVLLNVFFLNIS